MRKSEQTSVKNYSPVRVKDPSSDNHIVCLHPNQGFDLITSPYLGSVEIDVYSEYFFLLEKEYVNDICIYRFRQKYNLNHWTQASRVFLGTVMMISESLKRVVNLCVMLQAANNNDIITVINPNNDDIRFEPGNKLEIVLFDKDKPGTWQSKFILPENGLRLEQSQKTILLPADKNNSVLRRSSLDIKETHLFFWHDWASKLALTTLSDGIYPAGKIIFSNDEDADDTRELKLRLMIRSGKPKIFGQSLQKSSKFKSSLPPLPLKRPTCSEIVRVTYSKQYDVDGEYGGCEWPTTYVGKVVEKYDPNKRRHIKLEEIKNDALETGCKVLYFENGKKLPTECEEVEV